MFLHAKAVEGSTNDSLFEAIRITVTSRREARLSALPAQSNRFKGQKARNCRT
jgi:hypothetical protein